MAERGASGGGSGGDSLDKSITLPPDEIFRNLENAKRFTEQIQQQQVCLQQAEDFPNVFTTEVCKLREQLLKYQNEYTAAQEREYNIQYRLTR